jgi:hypothetical protein
MKIAIMIPYSPIGDESYIYRLGYKQGDKYKYFG